MGCWLGLDGSHARAWPKFRDWMGFACVLLECAFLVVHFSVFSRVALQNIFVPKLVENVS